LPDQDPGPGYRAAIVLRWRLPGTAAIRLHGAAAMMIMDAPPLTANGEIDRGKLPVPDYGATPRGNSSTSATGFCRYSLAPAPSAFNY